MIAASVAASACPKDSSVRERRDEHHMLLHESIARISAERRAAEAEIVTLKARIIRLELKLHPVIEEKQCG